MIPIW